LALVLTGVLVLTVTAGFAVHDDGLFEIDDPANAVNDGAVAGDDWDNVYTGTDSALRSLFITDGTGNTDDIFTTGGSKDIQDVSEWLRTTGSVPTKMTSCTRLLRPITAAAT
jgi:hypothetical protein